MGILDAEEVQRLYDRRAGHYDVLTLAFHALGFGRHQEQLVAELGLSEGAVVIDLCCGTGVNLAELSSAVGSRGAVIGVDLSEGMLSEARERVRAAGLANVQLVQADVRDYQLPDEAAAVLSTRLAKMRPSQPASPSTRQSAGRSSSSRSRWGCACASSRRRAG